MCLGRQIFSGWLRVRHSGKPCDIKKASAGSDSKIWLGGHVTSINRDGIWRIVGGRSILLATFRSESIATSTATSRQTTQVSDHSTSKGP